MENYTQNQSALQELDCGGLTDKRKPPTHTPPDGIEPYPNPGTWPYDDMDWKGER